MKKLTWYHELGFFENPFSIKPAAFHSDVEGYDNIVKDINKQIKQSSMLLITGEFGTGKTTILKKIIHEFEGKKNVIYYNCIQSAKSVDFEKLLVSMSWWRRLFGIKKKNMILLLDEAHGMNKKDMGQVKKYYEDGFFKSVVFVTTEKDIKLTNDLKKIIGSNKYGFGNINKEKAIELVRKRIGKLKFLSDDAIVKIFNKNTNPRAFLRNLENVCRYAFEKDTKEVKDEYIKILDATS